MLRHRVFASLLVFVDLAAAQGQGSYGGIAQGIAQLILFAVATFVILLLLLIRRVAGGRAALIATFCVVGAIASLVVVGQIKKNKRHSAALKIGVEWAKGCASATRLIYLTPSPDLPVFVRLKGEHLVPQRLRSAIVPTRPRMAEDVYFGEPPPNTVDAIQLDLSYEKNLVPGSYPGFEKHRVEYHLVARDLRSGKTLASAYDMQARNDFCHGSLEQFLRKALNRQEVLWTGSGGGHWPPRQSVPDAYVQGQYGAVEDVRFLQSNAQQESKSRIRALFQEQGCDVKDSSISPIVATCANGQIISLSNAINVQPIEQYLLVTYEIYKGMDFSSLRVEKRSKDWQLLYTWEANFAFPDGWTSSGEPQAFLFRQGGMDVHVYSDLRIERPQFQRFFTRKAVLRIPLPSLEW